MRLVVVASPSFSALNLLREAGIDFVATTDPTLLRDADIIVIAPRYGSLLRGLIAPHLRWIHALGAGVETLPFDELRKSDVIVTNSRGVYADALAEFAIAAMLWFAKDLRRLMRNQDAKLWEPYTVERVEGKSVGIIGYGGIGRAVGRRAEALGMRILAVSRHSGDIDDTLTADYIVLSTPLTPSTRGMIDAWRIARMKSTAVLINISRGAIVDEAALVDALREKRIRGAALDVFETEPLPPTHPLWTLDNVLISPHTADHAADSHERAMRFFLRNHEHFRRSEALENVVDKDREY
ncbi:MAG TPA: D-2-hydroxyacid dehydrogenase [Thermoanaerobaculia bacterium]|jgi:phosphoglycerate dehydrogenase-like enzyme|nr:D-2-hydroxyacid dehydrogenase [Thermoanaerobaculia bacterium]